MVIKIIFRSVIIILSTLFLFSCTPDEMIVSIYTSDFDAVNDGETIQVPVKLTFSMPGKDKNNDLEKVEILAKKYLEPKSKFTIVKTKYANSVVIETTIDFGKPKIPKNSLLQLIYYPAEKGRPPQVLIYKYNKLIKELNKQLRGVNLMLNLSLPPRNTKLRIISDTKTPYKIRAFSTWVSKKPYLTFITTINKREEAELLFKGRSSSVYS